MTIYFSFGHNNVKSITDGVKNENIYINYFNDVIIVFN